MISDRATGGLVIRTAQWQADRKRTATLDVHTGNLRAQAFYARLGRVPAPENPPEEGDHHLYPRYTVAGRVDAAGE
ncbi:hypothetical protein WJM95_06820 [Streptomyces sp. f51]|uniref:hypothetical protein n=1 Tax=Streptomyces sp. f51 TaxID=1827742 RepID=UPI0030D2D748